MPESKIPSYPSYLEFGMMIPTIITHKWNYCEVLFGLGQQEMHSKSFEKDLSNDWKIGDDLLKPVRQNEVQPLLPLRL